MISLTVVTVLHNYYSLIANSNHDQPYRKPSIQPSRVECLQQNINKADARTAGYHPRATHSMSPQCLSLSSIQSRWTVTPAAHVLYWLVPKTPQVTAVNNRLTSRQNKRQTVHNHCAK